MSEIIACKELPHFLDTITNIYSQGGLFVYPTETLYGLGANPFDEMALKRLFSVKNRPVDMPVSIAVSNSNMMKKFVEVNELAEKIINSLLPGPVTLLLESRDLIQNYLTSGNKVGIRIPDHKVALKIIDHVGPITATSANLHQRPDPRNVKEAYHQLGDNVKLYIDCSETRYNGPSTVVDCSEGSINIIRMGVIPENEIMALFE
jgi:L-threonylcarbamoyladenylate synthase